MNGSSSSSSFLFGGGGGGGPPSSSSSSVLTSSSASGVSQKVNVAIRVRPLIEREKTDGAKVNWVIKPNCLQHVDPDSGLPKSHNSQFSFDHIYGPHVKTATVYEDIVAPMVNEAFNGFNGTVLCYGQTSSGKTHTLYGNESDPGIINFLAEDIHRKIESSPPGIKIVIQVNLIEIYNENVIDLLCSENPIEIVEMNGSVVPLNAEHIDIVSAADITKAAGRLQRERKLGDTRMNSQSSRSHTILRMTINRIEEEQVDSSRMLIDLSGDESSLESTPGKRLISAVLNFVDLAGSEKASQTGATGDRLREAGHINTSLSALSKVVNQLSKQWETANKRENSQSSSLALSICNSMEARAPKSRMPSHFHVSYRDSKLTRLLQSSLEGGALIAMICNVTPASSEETLSTLRFALSAKEIQTKPKQNLITDKLDKRQYESTIKELQAQIFGKDEELKALRLALLSANAKKEDLCYEQDERRKTFHFRTSTARNWGSLSMIEEHEIMPRHHQLVHLSPPALGDEINKLKESAMDKSPLSSVVENPVKRNFANMDQEVQTDEAVTTTPVLHKRLKLDQDEKSTPIATLRLQKTLLSTTYEEDKIDWQQEKELLRTEKELIQKELEEMKGELIRLQKLLADKEQQQEEHCASLESSKENLQKEIKLLQSEKELIQRAHEEDMADWLRGKEVLRKANELSQQEKELLRTEKELIQKELEEMKGELIRLQKLLPDNLKLLSDAEGKNEELNNKLEEMATAANTGKSEIQTLKTRCETLTRDLEMAKKSAMDIEIKKRDELKEIRKERDEKEKQLGEAIKFRLEQEARFDNMASVSIQCDYLKDLLETSTKGEMIALPSYVPNEAKDKSLLSSVVENPVKQNFANMDQEVQTDEAVTMTPVLHKRMKLDQDEKSTPIATLCLQKTLLSTTYEEDKIDWQHENELLRTENELIQKDLEEMKGELIRLQKLLPDNLKLLSDAEGKNEELNNKLEEMATSANTGRSEIQSLKTRCETLTRDLEMAKKSAMDIEIKKRDWQQEKELLRTEKELIQKELEEMKGELIRLQKLLPDNLKLLSDAEGKNEELNNKLEEMVTAANTGRSEIQSLKTRCETLTRDLEMAKKSAMDIEIKKRDWQQEKELLRTEKELIQKELEEMKGEMTRLQKLLADKQTQQQEEGVNVKYTEKLKEDLRASWKDNKALEQQMKDLKDHINAKEAEIDALSHQLSQKNDGASTSSSTNIEKLEEAKIEMSRLNEELKETMGTKLQLLSDAEKKIEELNKKLEEMATAANTVIRRPAKVNRAQQTPDEWTGKSEIQSLKIRCKTLTRDLEMAKKSAMDIEIKKRDELKEIRKERDEKETQLGEAIKFRLEQEARYGNMANVSIQCDYLKDLLEKSTKGEMIALPSYIPNIAKLELDIRGLKATVYSLESALKKCTCDKNSDRRKRVYASTVDTSESSDVKEESEEPLPKKQFSRMGSVMDRKGSSLFLKTASPSMFPKGLSIATGKDSSSSKNNTSDSYTSLSKSATVTSKQQIPPPPPPPTVTTRLRSHAQPQPSPLASTASVEMPTGNKSRSRSRPTSASTTTTTTMGTGGPIAKAEASATSPPMLTRAAAAKSKSKLALKTDEEVEAEKEDFEQWLDKM